MRIKWSHSIDRNVRACNRRVFLNTVFACPRSRNGSIRRETYLLKSAVDEATWRGNLVHLVMEEKILPWIRKGFLPDFSEALDWAVRLTDRQANFSKREAYRSESRASAGNEFCILREDYLGNGVEDEMVNRVKADIAISMRNLETSFADLLARAMSARTVKIEEDLHVALGDGIQVDAKVDLLFFEYDGTIVIVDWKTTGLLSGNARDQLHAYAYAVHRSGYWGDLTDSKFELIEANLLSGERAVYGMSEDDLADVDDRVFGGSRLLEPIFAESAASCSPAFFAPADSPGACDWCNVKEMCNGTLYAKLSEATGQPGLLFELV